MNTDLIIILDFGGREAYYTGRRLRGEQYYCELMSADTPVEAVLSRAPKGIILAGGDACEDCPFPFDPKAYGVPVLAFGGAARILARALGGNSLCTKLRQSMDGIAFSACELFEELTQCDRFFERVDNFDLPSGCVSIAETSGGLPAGFACPEANVYGIQFYVESNDPEGLKILENFAGGICHCANDWTVDVFAPKLIESVRSMVGNRDVLLSISGGVESAVAAGVLHRAIGSRLSCLFIDTGLMRKGEPEMIRRCYYDQMGISLIEIDAADRFMKALRGISDSEEKRRVMQDEYAAVFAEQYVKTGSAECMAEGTTYSDIIKLHGHSLANLIDGCALIKPLQLLFKDDVNKLGHFLNIPEELLNRPPFEFFGLGVRCLGAITPERLDMLRRADAIFMQEVDRAGLAHRIAQYFVVLTDLKTPGQNGEGYVCALRALGASSAGRAAAYKLPYDLMDSVVRRITTEIDGITHVVYDITGRPIAAVEWE